MSNFNSADIAAFKDVWVFCEQREGKLMPTDFELISKGRDLADELGRKKAVRSYQYDRATAKAVETCKQAGIAYGEYLLAKQAADQNGNGSVTKDEAKTYLDSRSDLRKSQKASLFSAFSTAKQTPYQ